MVDKNKNKTRVVITLQILLMLAEEGKIEGIVVGFRDNEKSCQFRWCGLTRLEEIGLAANLQAALLRQGRE